jgi:hypothetical protein
LRSIAPAASAASSVRRERSKPTPFPAARAAEREPEREPADLAQAKNAMRVAGLRASGAPGPAAALRRRRDRWA